MRNLRTIIALAALVASLLLSNIEVRAQKQVFGYLSYSAHLQAMPEYAEVQNSVKRLHDTYDQESKHSEDHFYNLYSEYIIGQKTFPEEIMLKRQKELQTAMELNINFKKEAEKLVRKTERELMATLETKLDAAIAVVARHFKLSFVANTDNHAYPYLNPEDGLDISDYVIMVLNNQPLPPIEEPTEANDSSLETDKDSAEANTDSTPADEPSATPQQQSQTSQGEQK